MSKSPDPEVGGRRRASAPEHRGRSPAPQRRPPRRPPQAPAQVQNLRIVRELEDAIALAWKKPVDGGRLAGYQVQRRTPGSRWNDVATAVTTEIELERQERVVELEYRVVAFNGWAVGGRAGRCGRCCKGKESLGRRWHGGAFAFSR